MSLRRDVVLACSRCANSQPFTVWDSINISVDPHLKPMLLDGRLTTFRCRKCGYAAHIAYDCLYHDMSRSVMIWLKYVASEGESELDPSSEQIAGGFDPARTCRIVTSFQELLDKIHIFDDGFTDYYVELAKFSICEQTNDHTQRLYYKHIRTSWFRGRSLVFAREGLDSFAEVLFPVRRMATLAPVLTRITNVLDSTDQRWQRVDRNAIWHALAQAGIVRQLTTEEVEAHSIKVHTHGKPPRVENWEEFDTWIAGGGDPFGVEEWHIGIDISADQAEEHRDPVTGDLYVSYKIIDGERTASLISREAFEKLQAFSEVIRAESPQDAMARLAALPEGLRKEIEAFLRAHGSE